MNSGLLAGRLDGKLLTCNNNKLTDYCSISKNSGAGVLNDDMDPPFNDDLSTHLTQGLFYGMLRACVFVANIFQVPFLTGLMRRSNVSLLSRDVICRCVFVSGSIGARPMANFKRCCRTVLRVGEFG